METRTPVTQPADNISPGSNRSRERGRQGYVVLCSTNGTGLQIKLGSSSNLASHQSSHADELQQQEDAKTPQDLATRTVDDHPSPLRHVQPSAPGQQTLERPRWSGRSDTSTSITGIPTTGHGEDGGQKQPMETVRPPPFNPDCSASTGPTGVKSGLDVSHQLLSAGSTTLPPPSYEDIYGDRKDDLHQHQHQQLEPPHEQQTYQQEKDSFQTSSDAVTTTHDSAGIPSSLPCVAKFGQYTDPTNHPQPGYFTNPMRISVLSLSQTDDPQGPSVMVVDQSASSVQLFTSSGDSLGVLRVPRVNGGCFIGHQPPMLLLAVGTSVCVYEMTGRLVKEIPLTGRQHDDTVLTTVPYGERGFVAVRSRSLSICQGGITGPAVVRTLAGRHRVDRGTSPFVNVIDVSVDSRRGHLIVLDAADPSVSGHRAAVYIMTEEGSVVRAIRPARDPHCGALFNPHGLTVDRAGNLLVADSGRLLQFSGEDGRYMETLLGEHNSTESEGFTVWGVAAANVGTKQLAFAVVTGVRFAQVRAYSLQ